MSTAPRYLGPEGRRLWRATWADFELSEHETALLRQACIVADVCADLRARVAAEGTMTADRFGQVRPNPALVELRLQQALLSRLIAALRVPLGEEDEDAPGGPAEVHNRRSGPRGAASVSLVRSAPWGVS